jgi:hypothetical protein
MKAKTLTMLMGLLLLAFAALYLFVAGPGIASEMNLGVFLRQKTTELLIFLSVGIILHLLLTRTKKENLHFIADAIIVASTIGLMVEVRHFRESYEQVDIGGEWLYEVQNSDGIITHGGISTIRQESGDTLMIKGWRRYRQRCPTSGCIGTETQLEQIPHDGSYWWTDFAVIRGGETKQIDFVYTIILQGMAVRGYCHLTPETNDRSPGKLEGTYTHLAPGKLMGNIVFRKMHRREALEYIKRRVAASQPPASQP